MGKRRRWSPSKLMEKKLHGNEKTLQVDINGIDEAYLDKFLGRISFWSFTYKRVNPDKHSSKFRVVTTQYIPKYKLIQLVEAVFPEGCRVVILMGYSFRHTFDVRTTYPLKWKDFIWKITKGLEGVL